MSSILKWFENFVARRQAMSVATGYRELVPGDRVDNYEIVRKVADDGFGTVYLATDRLHNREVAIKTMNLISTASDPAKRLQRFAQGANTLASLHHKNIINIYDFSEHWNRPYMAMEYLDGNDLRHVIESKAPLSLLTKVSIMSEVADGLDFAHKRGIVHMDVKPENICVLRDGSVKITDFCIARPTRPSVIIGTPGYIAPERNPPTRQTDARCDIWAFGVVYYELVSGVHPFAAPDEEADYDAMEQNVLSSFEPVPVHKRLPDCPPVLSRAINRLLAKDPTARHQTLHDLLLDTSPVLIQLRAADSRVG